MIIFIFSISLYISRSDNVEKGFGVIQKRHQLTEFFDASLIFNLAEQNPGRKSGLTGYDLVEKISSNFN